MESLSAPYRAFAFFRRRLLLAVLLLAGATSARGAVAVAGSRPPARNWIANPSVDRDTTGWHTRSRAAAGSLASWDAHGGRGGSGALRLAVTRNDTLPDYAFAPGWAFRVDSVPVGRRMHWSAWMRGKGCAVPPVAGVQVLSADHSLLAATGSEDHAGTFGWTHVEGELDVPEGSARMQFVLMLPARGDAWFDDFSLTDAGPVQRLAPMLMQPAWSVADSAWLYLARSEEQVWRQPSFGAPASVGRIRVQLALPRADAHQVPAGLDLWTEPRASLVTAGVHEDSLGNLVADLLVDPSAVPDSTRGMLDARKCVRILWRAPVLVSPESLATIPEHAAFPERWPDEALPWLQPTPCAQADDPKIVAIAHGIRAGTSDVAEVIRRTLTFMGPAIAGATGTKTSWQFDAVSALTDSGSCVSCANLAAALLRANGIPTRILSGIPTGGIPCDVHFVVEAWLPGHGWYRIESTQCRAPWPASGQVIASVLPPTAEERGAPHRPAGVGCMGWLSILEFVDGCADCHAMGTLTAEGAGQVATRLDAAVPAGDPADGRRAFERSRERWRAWVASAPRPGFDGHLRTPFEARQVGELLSPAPPGRE